MPLMYPPPPEPIAERVISPPPPPIRTKTCGIWGLHTLKMVTTSMITSFLHLPFKHISINDRNLARREAIGTLAVIIQ